MDKSQYRTLPLSGYVDITRVDSISQLTDNDVFLVQDQNNGFSSRKVRYSDIKDDLFNYLSTIMQTWITNKVTEVVDQEMSDYIQSTDEKVAKLSADVMSLSNDVLSNWHDLSIAMENIEDIQMDIKRLSSDKEMMISAVLKVANCQLSIRTELDNVYSNLSVVVC